MWPNLLTKKDKKKRKKRFIKKRKKKRKKKVKKRKRKDNETPLAEDGLSSGHRVGFPYQKGKEHKDSKP